MSWRGKCSLLCGGGGRGNGHSLVQRWNRAKETHQTILKSFGRTHILVFVNTTPQDSGLVMFYVGRSKTSSQLRVKGMTTFL